MVCVLFVESDAVDAFLVALVQSVHLCPVSAHSEYIIVVFVVFYRVSFVFVAVVADQNVGVRLLCHLVRCNSCVESF